mgnify:CR=1 FL=1
MSAVLIPLIIPLTLALLSGFVKARHLFALNIFGSLLLLISALYLLFSVFDNEVLTVQFGAWPMPYGITFMADGLSAVLIIAIALVFLSVLLLMKGHKNWHEFADNSAHYQFVLLQGLMAASIAVTLTSDLFNLYVWFELILMSVLGLLIIRGKQQNFEAAIKYFTINMLGTLLMLSAVGFIYGISGQLNFEAVKQASLNEDLQPQMQIYSALFVLALLMKVGAFPLFIWLPASYHTLPLPLLALIGGLLTKITAYVLLRLSGQVFDIEFMLDALGWLAVLTMLSGAIGAAYHWDLRRILAFHIVSQVGFLLLGIALASQAGAVGTTLFLVHNILVKTNLFLIAGAIFIAAKHYDLRKVGGLYPANILLAVLFLINAMALVGVPPTTGFWGKFLILQETIHQQHLVWAIAALITGFLTLYSMSKIWQEVFWKKPLAEQGEIEIVPKTVMLPIISITVLVVLIGIYPDPIIAFLQHTFLGFYGG